MSCPTRIKSAFAALLLAAGVANAQVVTTNPGEYAVDAAGNVMINNAVKSETKAERETAWRQNAMVAEFVKMKQWEGDYNSYLKTASGYASALKAATSIYDDGMRILITLDKLRKAVEKNLQGILATAALTDLYAETATELVSVFTLLKNAVAKGGEENMLTGAERSKTLWNLEDKLSALSHKLQLLYRSIRHYSISDVWDRATSGVIERCNGDVAKQSLSHWKRYARETAIYSR